MLGVLYFIDTQDNTLALFGLNKAVFADTEVNVARHWWWENGALFGFSTPTVQIAGHTIIVLSPVTLRFFLWIVAGVWYAMWLDDFFTHRVLGEERAKALIEYVNKVVEADGFLPATRRFFGAFSKPQPTK
ncbi:MAG TPA: hypothetical protein VMM15_31215 [Bradyrhizobium sp.]|nr:hypothetical protein [Bradyrhizobium sp.]